MLQLAVECARDKGAPWPSRIQAISLVVDRAWGKPKEHLSVDADGIHTLRIEFVDPRDGFIGNDAAHRHNGSGNGDARTISSESFEISFADADAPEGEPEC